MRFVVCILFVALLGSCGSRKKVQERFEVRKSDTLLNKVEVLKSAPVLSSLIVEELCGDSVQAKEFVQRIVVEKDTIEIQVKDNRLEVVVDRLEQVVHDKQQLISKSDREIIELREELRVSKRTPIEYYIMLLYIGLVVIRKVDEWIPLLPISLRKVLRWIA